MLNEESKKLSQSHISMDSSWADIVVTTQTLFEGLKDGYFFSLILQLDH